MVEKLANRILAVETSTDFLGVSIVDAGGVRFEITTSQPRIHSALLLPLCVYALEMVDVELNDIDCFAVSTGPGSFTGLRIGCAAVQGLALARNKPVVKVPTFEVYLRQCRGYDNLAVVQGRAKGQTVCAFYRRALLPYQNGEGFCNEYGFEQVVTIGPRSYEEFCQDLMKSAKERIWVTGDAAYEFAEFASTCLPCEVRLVDEYLLLPRPGIVGLIGRQMFAHGQAVHPSLVVPEYYRKSYAEVIFSQRQDEGEMP